MTLTVVFEKDGFRPLPSGFYRLRLIGIEPSEGAYGGNPVFLFNYQVVKVIKLEDPSSNAANLVNRTIRDYVSQTIATNSKLYELIQKLSGDVVPIGEEYDLLCMLGCECIGLIQKTETKNKITEYYTDDEYDELSN